MAVSVLATLPFSMLTKLKSVTPQAFFLNGTGKLCWRGLNICLCCVTIPLFLQKQSHYLHSLAAGKCKWKSVIWFKNGSNWAQRECSYISPVAAVQTALTSIYISATKWPIDPKKWGWQRHDVHKLSKRTFYVKRLCSAYGFEHLLTPANHACYHCWQRTL